MEKAKHRTQVSLEQWQYQRLIELSRKTKRSLSGIIRDLIAEKFPAEVPDKRAGPLSKVISMAAGDGTPVARDHDRFLYGKKEGSGSSPTQAHGMPWLTERTPTTALPLTSSGQTPSPW